jgi:hypothetical protein
LEIQDTIDKADGSSAPDIVDEDLALRLGIRLEDVRRALRRLTRVGVIEFSDSFVLVKDPQRLGEFLDFVRNPGSE